MIRKLLSFLGIKKQNPIHLCYGGLEISSKTGLSSFCIVFPYDNLRIVPFFWIPKGTVGRDSLKDGSNYPRYIEQGYVTMTAGDGIDYVKIQQDIGTICKVFGCKRIGYDPWSASSLAQSLSGDGLEMVEVRQVFSTLAHPTLILKHLIDSNKILSDNPVFLSMIKRIDYIFDHGGNGIPQKGNTSGIFGTLNAISLMSKDVVVL